MRRRIRGAPRGPLEVERAGTSRQQRGEEAMTDKKMKQIVAAVERGEGDNKKSYWTRIGVAFENRDHSFNLRFDYFPAHLDRTTIQLRDFDPKED
jgi:hypothetical protein